MRRAICDVDFERRRWRFFKASHPTTDEPHMPCHIDEEVWSESAQKDPDRSSKRHIANGSRRKQKRSFLLIETVTASVLALIAMLACVSIFFLLWKASSTQQALLVKKSLHWRRTSTLRWTLSRIKRDGKDDPFLLQENGGSRSRLVFIFDHGVHVNPKLSNHDLAQLYVDPQKGLVLVTRSHPKRAGIGQEEEVASIIWPGVKNVEWRFAIRPKDKAGMVGIEEYLKDNWITTWRPEWSGLPAVIQAIITDEDDEQTIVTAISLQDLGAIPLK